MRLTLSAAAALLCLSALPAPAQQMLESYTALLSAKDHYNSSGQRLTAWWQVLRQDRANFHRYGRADAQDEWDSFFGSTENRARMEAMLKAGGAPEDMSRAILNNEVMVRVDVYPSWVQVTLY